LVLPVEATEENTNEMIKYALITSLNPSIDKAISEIYKDEPKGVPQWAGWNAEIINIKQLNGIGGSYEVKVRIYPYYGPHIGKGVDEIQLELMLMVKS